MTSKLVVNTIEADTGISSVSFASSISMNSTAKFHFSAAGIDIGADTNINRPAAGVLGFNVNGTEKVRIDTNGHIHGVGVVTATHVYGDGSNLTGITQTTINSNTNNYVVTATGTANTLQGESNLRFNGSSFSIGGHDPQKRFHVREDNNSQHHIAYLQNRYAGNSSSSLIAMSCGGVDFSDNKYAHMGAVISGVNENGTNLIFGTNEHNGSVQTRLTIRPNGQLLIGTATTPSNSNSKLRVHFDQNTSSGNAIEMSHSTNGADKAGAALGLAIANGGASTNAADLYFSTATNGSLTERLRITSTGRLKIGSSTATGEACQLTLTHTNNSGVGLIDIDSYGSATLQIRSNWSGSTINGMPNQTFGFGTPHAYPLVFTTSSTERLRIDADGRIGINANPSVNHEYLHIKPVGNNVLDLRYELNSSTDIRHKFYDNAGVWRGGFNYTTYANSSAYPNFHDSFYFLTDPGSNGTLETALRITNTGQFIKPLTYQFFLESSGTSVSGGWTKLTGMSLDSTHCTGVSNGTYWSNSNQRFTAPVTGTYQFFIGGFSPTAEGGGTNHRYMYLFRINGGNYKYGMGGNYSDNNTPMEGGTLNYKLTVNDYVEVWYYSAISATWGNSSHRFFWGGILLG